MRCARVTAVCGRFGTNAYVVLVKSSSQAISFFRLHFLVKIARFCRSFLCTILSLMLCMCIIHAMLSTYRVRLHHIIFGFVSVVRRGDASPTGGSGVLRVCHGVFVVIRSIPLDKFGAIQCCFQCTSCLF